MSLLFVVGCSWGNQNQLCWISYSTNILWVSSPLWCSCSWSFGREVSVYFSFLMASCVSIWLHPFFSFFLLFNLFILGIVHSCFRSNSYYFFVNSCDEQVACQMILDKKGLKGYQVIHISPWNSFWWCYVVVLGLGWDKEALPMYPVCHGGTFFFFDK